MVLVAGEREGGGGSREAQSDGPVALMRQREGSGLHYSRQTLSLPRDRTCTLRGFAEHHPLLVLYVCRSRFNGQGLLKGVYRWCHLGLMPERMSSGGPAQSFPVPVGAHAWQLDPCATLIAPPAGIQPLVFLSTDVLVFSLFLWRHNYPQITGDGGEADRSV
ncbi:hypothetical protein BaRGS_00019120 [Batillaria attramentaria]|uniref:Uncharacterized protein n=1 Tax=Batillaria attramentaria TaxID=370345 RepID=A0ABD0KRG3_9CAEN